MSYKVTLEFHTGRPSYGRSRGTWSMTKEFNDLRHCNNFIKYIERTKGYMLDEVFYEGDYPFNEGDDYWVIEDNTIVWSCWDEISEQLFDSNRIYFTSFYDAEKYAEGMKNVKVISLGEKFFYKAVRVPDFDMVDCPQYGETPYGVCLDVYYENGEFCESGHDWSYFSTESEAEEYVNKFNNKYKKVIQ